MCSSHSVYLGVCPVQFALYVKLHTVMRAAHVFSAQTYNEYFDNFIEHSESCGCDDRVKVNNGRLVLLPALHSSSLCDFSLWSRWNHLFFAPKQNQMLNMLEN